MCVKQILPSFFVGGFNFLFCLDLNTGKENLFPSLSNFELINLRAQTFRQCFGSYLFFKKAIKRVLYVVGDRKMSNRKVLKRKMNWVGFEDESNMNGDDVEVGFIGEAAEERLSN